MSNGSLHTPFSEGDQPSRQHRKVDEVQSILDRWDKRLRGHQQQKRSEKRIAFRGEIVVYIPPLPARSIGRPAEAAHSERAWARNVSHNGISFLCESRIDTEEVSICLDPHCESPKWYQGKIVRRREVQNEFWEYGIHLTGCLPNGPV